jgi:hypothetical protein
MQLDRAGVGADVVDVGVVVFTPSGRRWQKMLMVALERVGGDHGLGRPLSAVRIANFSAAYRRRRPRA